MCVDLRAELDALRARLAEYIEGWAPGDEPMRSGEMVSWTSDIAGAGVAVKEGDDYVEPGIGSVYPERIYRLPGGDEL